MNNKLLVKPSRLQDLETLSNEVVKVVIVINTTVKCDDWSAFGVKNTLVENRHRPVNEQDPNPLCKPIKTNIGC